MTWNLSDLSWEAFRDRVPSTTDAVMVPVGTLEAHGAMPLGTDNLIPAGLAQELAPRIGALVAPPVSYGVTNTLLPYPGSTTVSPATFQAYLFEAAAGLVDAGFRRVVLLNGHGGQSGEVGAVVRRLWAEKRAYSVAIEWWGLATDISREVYGEVVTGHAGVEETAMVLALAPDLVNPARHATIRRAHRQAGVQASGHIGDADPFVAVMNAVHDEGADEIIVSTFPQATSGWLRRDLIGRVRKASNLPVRHVVVSLGELEILGEGRESLRGTGAG